MALRLAEHVAGTVHVDEMLDGMTPEEFDEWMVKDQIEPIGYQNQMLGLIAWFVHSYVSGDTAGKADVFMPWLKYQPEENDQQAAKQALEMIAGRMGGRGKSRGFSGQAEG